MKISIQKNGRNIKKEKKLHEFLLTFEKDPWIDRENIKI